MRILKFNLSLILSLMILLTSAIPQGVEARTLTEKNISEVFDRFHYSMAVEWDQKDEAFRLTAQKELENALLDLKASGITDEEIQQAMMKNMLSERTQKEYDQMLKALKHQNLSEAEATEVAVNFLENKYQEGTNFMGKGGGWDGPGKHKWIICIIVVIVVTKLCLSRGGSNDNGGDNDEYNEYNYYY